MNLSGTKKVPPASVVLPHYAFGALCFFILSLMILFHSESFLGHYFNPALLSITHITVLGWISMVIFGALYQLVPVIMVAELFSNILARITFVLFTIGISLLSYSFAVFNLGIVIQAAAVIICFSVILFAMNIYLTAKKAEEKNTESDFILASVFWLLVTVIVGTLLVFNFTNPFLNSDHLHYLKLHSHLGFAGWFVLLIMGVGSKLLPMFLLSSVQSKLKLKIAYYSINTSLIFFFADAVIFLTTERVVIYFGIALAGIISFMLYIYEAFKSRARKNLDAGMKHSMLAFVLLIVPLLLGPIITVNIIDDDKHALSVVIVYGISILLGFISLLILGQTFKTLPFIVWLHKYKTPEAKIRQLLPKDMFSEKILKMQLSVFLFSYLLLQAGVIMRQVNSVKMAGALLVFSAILYNINVFKVLMYAIKLR